MKKCLQEYKNIKSEKQQMIQNVLANIERLKQTIQEKDYVVMRRHCNPKLYLDIAKSLVNRLTAKDL